MLMNFYSLGSSQSRWEKKYKEAEKAYQYYVGEQEDFERAAKSLEEMQRLIASKLKRKDELYAQTYIYQVDFLMRQAKLLQADSLLKIELEVLEASIEKKESLSSKHYDYLLVAGNIQLSLAIAHKEGVYILGLLKTPAWVRKAKTPYSTAVAHLDSAIAYYQKFYQERPEDTLVRVQLAKAFREKGEILGRYLQNLDACIESFQEGLQYRQEVESYRLLGVAYGIKGAHFKAIEAFEAALKLEERNLAILYNLEVAYRQLASVHQGDKAAEYTKLADAYHIKWKSINPNYQPGGG